MKRKKERMVSNVILCVLVLLFFVGAFIGGSMFIEYKSSGQRVGETVMIEIHKGEGAWDIADKLKEEGLIKSKIVFYLKARNMGVTGKLRYGTFTLYRDAGLQQLLEDLTSGGALKTQKMLTIPEGYTIEQIALEVEKEGICSKNDFLQAVEQDYDYWFLDAIPKDAKVKYQLQGFLFPDTYAIGEDMTAKDIVTVMLEQFNKKFTVEMQNKAKALGKSIYEIVIEASIIERETVLDTERAMVAGVIQNRLERDMLLQMCPTVLYPLTNGIYDKTTVSDADTLLDSPYNTYQNKGLPVGPIACPGLLSLEAALNPATHDYLFYHTDKNKNDGSHIFTKTYEEHINTQKYGS